MTVIVEEIPPLAVKLWLVGETVSAGVDAAAFCVTLIVLVIPPPETVTVALREEVEVFAVAVMVNVLLLLPLVREGVSHEALLDTVQDRLEVTVIVVEVPPLAAKL